MAAMEIVGSIEGREAALFAKIADTLSAIASEIEQAPTSLEESISVIEAIRRCAYENLNQLQHEALILKAIPYLENRCCDGQKPAYWQWHPRQTSGTNEADLQAFSESGTLLLSAEATTSLKSQGTITLRMQKTIRQLHDMEISGDKYYLVKYEAMETAAMNFIAKNYDVNLPSTIKVIRLH